MEKIMQVENKIPNNLELGVVGWWVVVLLFSRTIIMPKNSEVTIFIWPHIVQLAIISLYVCL